MTWIERRLAVGILLSLVFAIRLIAHREAGGLFRDQSDGLRAEGVVFALVVRLIFFFGGLVAIVVWFISPESLPFAYEPPGWLAWVSIVAIEVGISLLVWVHIALGVHFSGTLHLRDDHRLVQHGPYARVRHPMYTSFLLILGGLSCLMGNLMIGVVLMGSQLWVLFWRLPVEEAQLRERFGEQWQSHRRRTGALWPKWGPVD